MEWFVGEESMYLSKPLISMVRGGWEGGGGFFFYFFKNKVKIKILRLPNGVLFSMIAFLKIQGLLFTIFSFLFFSPFLAFFYIKKKGGKTSFQSRPFSC